MPKVSIAICTYNGAPYIVEQLESFEYQTRLPDEIVVCDDGSKDDTVDLISQYARTSKIPIRLYRNDKNLGYSQNFSKAILLTTGDIIFLSDQDDVWYPSKVEKFLKEFQKQPNVLMVYSDANLVNEKLEPLGQTFWQFHNFRPSDQAFMLSPRGFELTLQRSNMFIGSSMALRQPLKNMMLPFPLGLTHDSWLGMLSVVLGKISLINEPLNDYRQHSQQVSGQKKPGFFNTIKRRYKALQYFRGVAYYQRWLMEHQALRDRLSGITTYPVDSKIFDMLDAKITYLQSQIQLHQQPFLLRSPILYREWNSGRYPKFSLGWKQLVVDLLL